MYEILSWQKNKEFFDHENVFFLSFLLCNIIDKSKLH